MGAKLSDTGADWERYEQACSGGRSKPMRRVSRAEFELALRKLKAINDEINCGLMSAYPDGTRKPELE